MKSTRIIMGMPITVEVADASATEKSLEDVFAYFEYVDKKFSTYKTDSEVSKLNRGELKQADYSQDLLEVLQLSELTKKQSNGYFDIHTVDGKIDPSGLVKGRAILKAAEILKKLKVKNFYIEAGGDIQTSGKNSQGKDWVVGIRNPFKKKEIIKVVHLSGQGIATSGSYERGQHIYNPHDKNQQISDIVSLSVMGPNVYEADRFATAAFAMGKQGINFIESLAGLEGYMVDKDGVGTQTSGFGKYLT